MRQTRKNHPASLAFVLVAVIVLVAGPSSAQMEARGSGVELNLRDAEIGAFVELVSRVTGRNFIVDPRVRGTVTVVAPEPVDAEALMDIFQNVLQINRFALVRGQGADRIVPLTVARELPPDAQAPPDGFVTGVLRVEHMSLKDAENAIRPLLAAEAVLTAMPDAQMLILSDSTDSIARVRSLLGRLDRPVSQDIDLIALQNASARDVADTLNALELRYANAKITPNLRTNSLLVSGSDEFRLQIQMLVSELDRPRSATDATVVPLRYAEAANIATVVSQLFAPQNGAEGAGGGPTVVADTTTNSVLIAAAPDRLSSIIAAVEALDKRPSQVLIEGVIFEMGADKFAELGVQFGSIISDVFAGGVQFSVGGAPTIGSLITTLLGGNVPALGNGLSVGGQVKTGTNQGVAGFISALARDSSTNILSTPSILTLDNQAAEIVVAQNVPFVTGRFATVGDDAIPDTPFQTIQRQDVGLTLRVTPQITVDGTVRLRVEQEISNLTAAAAASGSEITQRRAIDTTILVGNERLVLLGGLLEDQSTGLREKVPGLGDVPVLKYLFSAKSKTGTKRILLLLLKPTIIETDGQYASVTERATHKARGEETAMLASSDRRYPRVDRAKLPAMLPELGEPFDPDRSPDRDAPPAHHESPALPPRLSFE